MDQKPAEPAERETELENLVKIELARIEQAELDERAAGYQRLSEILRAELEQPDS